MYNAVYSSDWYNQSTQYKKFARMMIMHAQKPVKITAGQFGVLSLPLFARVSKILYVKMGSFTISFSLIISIIYDSDFRR